MKESQQRYVLVTPVKNEEHLFGETIRSVVAQTIKPCEWVIVSDGSTDGTNELVRAAAVGNPWIRLIELGERKGRNFGAVVKNTELGISQLNTEEPDFIGLLDADVRFQEDYFEKVISEFSDNPKLGLAGGVVIDVGLPRDRFPKNRKDVPGAVQFFRETCFQAIGGLVPIPEGGWDGITCAMARMKGFDTRLLTELVVDHLKPRNVAEGGMIRRKWQMGRRDYALGYDVLFECVKCMGRVFHSPVLVGAASWLCGYLWASVTRPKRHIPEELVVYLRSEQKERLKRVFRIGGRQEYEQA